VPGAGLVDQTEPVAAQRQSPVLQHPSVSALDQPSRGSIGLGAIRSPLRFAHTQQQSRIRCRWPRRIVHRASTPRLGASWLGHASFRCFRLAPRRQPAIKLAPSQNPPIKGHQRKGFDWRFLFLDRGAKVGVGVIGCEAAGCDWGARRDRNGKIGICLIQQVDTKAPVHSIR
jgi:hypothetical protein